MHVNLKQTVIAPSSEFGFVLFRHFPITIMSSNRRFKYLGDNIS